MAVRAVRIQTVCATSLFGDSLCSQPPSRGGGHRNERQTGATLPLRIYETVISEPTIVDYGERKDAAHWLSPKYIDLHMRTARLVNSEAKNALHRHFEKPGCETQTIPPRKQALPVEEEFVPIVCDTLTWEAPLSMAYKVDEDRSFLEEAFC